MRRGYWRARGSSGGGDGGGDREGTAGVSRASTARGRAPGSSTARRDRRTDCERPLFE